MEVYIRENDLVNGSRVYSIGLGMTKSNLINLDNGTFSWPSELRTWQKRSNKKYKTTAKLEINIGDYINGEEVVAVVEDSYIPYISTRTGRRIFQDDIEEYERGEINKLEEKDHIAALVDAFMGKENT